MSTDVVAEVVVRPIRDSDVEALGRVHATCWHETYDHLISAAAFEHLSPRRMAELWNHYAERGEEYQQFAALVDGEIVGFVGSGPARDENPPATASSTSSTSSTRTTAPASGRSSSTPPSATSRVYLWVASDNPRAHRFYARNGFTADGADQHVPFLGEEIHEVRLVR